MIPIDKNTNDKFYRYKMPQAATVKEGKKTVVSNMDLISKSLHRDPVQIMKFIGMTLGCTPTVDGTKFVLNGSFESERIQQLIYEYIDLFVLCTKCGNPETKFILTNDVLERKCNSCGAEIAQSAHKLNSLISKNVYKGVNEDCNYKDAENALLPAETRESREIPPESEANGLKQLFSGYFKSGDVKKHENLIKSHRKEDVLGELERMLERNGKEGKIDGYLDELCKIGYDCDDIEKYFGVLEPGQKRSALIKRGVKCFIENYEEDL